MTKIVIESNYVKRELALPAQICVTRQTAHKIREAMEAFIGSDASYGWVTIHDDEAQTRANSTPLSWSEGSPAPTSAKPDAD